LAWLWLVIVPVSAIAEEPHHVQSVCSERTSLRSTGTVNLRIDNDVFGGVGQDQGYSNGFLVRVLALRSVITIPPAARSVLVDR